MVKLEFLQRFKRTPETVAARTNMNVVRASKLPRLKSIDLIEMPDKPWTVDLIEDVENGNTIPVIHAAEVTGFAQQKAPNSNKVLDYLYVVEVLWTNSRRCVIKRSFKDFYNFHVGLVHEFRLEPKDEGPMTITKFLPAWKARRQTGIGLAETRELQLNRYVHELLSLPTNVTHCRAVLKFFESRVSDPKPYKYESADEENSFTSQSDYVACWI